MVVLVASGGLRLLWVTCISCVLYLFLSSELNVDNWNDKCEAKSETKSHRTLRGLQVDFSLTRNVSYAVR